MYIKWSPATHWPWSILYCRHLFYSKIYILRVNVFVCHMLLILGRLCHSCIQWRFPGLSLVLMLESVHCCYCHSSPSRAAVRQQSHAPPVFCNWTITYTRLVVKPASTCGIWLQYSSLLVLDIDRYASRTKKECNPQYLFQSCMSGNEKVYS